MSIYRHHSHAVPELNTSSLPDLIFSVLFFFMIVTHMRTDLLKVRYQVPQGTELQKLTHKSTVTHIYIGKAVEAQSVNGAAEDQGSPYEIQVNDKLVTPEELASYLQAERAHTAAEDAQHLSAVISADKDAPMSLITDVKLALRKANILKVSYTGLNKR